MSYEPLALLRSTTLVASAGALTGSGGAATTVSDCLAAFFASEDITWSCEAESKAAAAAAARTSASATDATSATEAPSPVTATPFAAVAGTSAQPPGSIDGSQTSGAAARRVRGLLSSELGSASSATTYSRKVHPPQEVTGNGCDPCQLVLCVLLTSSTAKG